MASLATRRAEEGETPWRNVFELLRDLRPWGPDDRIRKRDSSFLQSEIEGRDEDELIRLEIELVYRSRDDVARLQEQEVREVVATVSAARINDISYHAILVDLPVSAVQALIDRRRGSLAALDPVMHVRPQSTATQIEISDQGEARRRTSP